MRSEITFSSLLENICKIEVVRERRLATRKLVLSRDVMDL